ncbi:hypothetical protein N7532_003623 [Penicillium argentinense]|uniref:Uncharacterized protein n=1 Tax=Penicillium argentinense TaxID=1131581 RepID=A0A9W9KE66_9EURO|nr:uncharacterized protein N7532_003623 [Penicillium argentinense]KAJ5103094.1 hypothetical protein N7532_003623 [Penicillium argentinense]
MIFSSALLSLSLAIPFASAYHLAVTDQNSKTVRVFPRDASKWNNDAIYWSFTADAGLTWPWEDDVWADLSDVKIRKTADRGFVALVAASGGKVGMIDIIAGQESTDLDDVIWSATPGDNPHSLERIPNLGAFVAASSDPGKLTLYVPTDASDVNNLDKIKKSHEYSISKAHGVLWHSEKLWAIGEDYLYKFDVVGKGKDIKLERDGSPIALPKVPHRARNGHDLSASYKDPDVLLLTHTAAAYTYNVKTGKFKTLINEEKIKSLVQASSGEYAWIKGEKNEMGQYVSFSDESAPGTVTDKRGWGDAEFYKAKIFDPDYE